MKDEFTGEQVLEFVGFRAKLYNCKTLRSEIKKCKGVKKYVVEKEITFEDYKKCLDYGGSQRKPMNVCKSRKHEIYTEEVNKVALSSNDDKRIISKDGNQTLAIGHYGCY